MVLFHPSSQLHLMKQDLVVVVVVCRVNLKFGIDMALSHPFQAQTYDPEGEYVAYWLPRLRTIPKDKRNFPGSLYIRQIVPLKFGTTGRHHNEDKSMSARRANDRGTERRWNRR